MPPIRIDLIKEHTDGEKPSVVYLSHAMPGCHVDIANHGPNEHQIIRVSTNSEDEGGLVEFIPMKNGDVDQEAITVVSPIDDAETLNISGISSNVGLGRDVLAILTHYNN